MKVRISEIVVGERRREDMGDIQGLADSITRYGLLQPIIVDATNKLVAGGRRLEAVKLLGWESIQVRPIGELSEKELRAIELEENIRRKDLTEYEKSKNMVELATIVKEQIKEDNCPAEGQFIDEHKGGRSKKSPGSYRDIEERTGIPRTVLQRAEKHVQAVDKYPELKELPKEEAIKVAKKLDDLPLPEREEKLQKVREYQERTQEEQKQIDKQFRIKKVFTNAVYDVSLLQVHEENLSLWLMETPRSEIEQYLSIVKDGIKKLTEIENHLSGILSGPRLAAVKGGKQ